MSAWCFGRNHAAAIITSIRRAAPIIPGTRPRIFRQLAGRCHRQPGHQGNGKAEGCVARIHLPRHRQAVERSCQIQSWPQNNARSTVQTNDRWQSHSAWATPILGYYADIEADLAGRQYTIVAASLDGDLECAVAIAGYIAKEQKTGLRVLVAVLTDSA